MARPFLVACSLLALFAPFPSEASGFPDQGLGISASGEVILARDGLQAVFLAAPGTSRGHWAALLGSDGILVRDGGTGTTVLAGEFPVVALASQGAGRPGGRQVVFAARGGGLFSLDLATGATALVSEVRAVSLAAGDVLGKGREELLAGLPEGSLLLIENGSGAESMIATGDARLLTAGDFLGRGHDQIALGLETGEVRLLDLPAGESLLLGSPSLANLAAGDVDGDGRDDLVAQDREGNLLKLDFVRGAARWIDLDASEVRIEDRFIVIRARQAPVPGGFIRADANLDGEVDISDAVGILSDLFLGVAAKATCRKALDANDDGSLDLSDAIFALSFLFLDGRGIPPPFPGQGIDPTPDAIPCAG